MCGGSITTHLFFNYMAVLQRSEFTLALNQVASERGVDAQIVLDTIKGAILAAYRKDHGDDDFDPEQYSVELDPGSGETHVMHEGKDVTPPGFGRIAAQTAKQVLLQKIREREKDAIIEEYTKRIGTVVNGMILRFQGPVVIVDVGKSESIMPPQHKIPNESYFLNKKIAVYIAQIDDEAKGRGIIVSRTHPGLVEGLFRREVPEVAAGSVVIKKVVREPGNRAKIAVYSEQSGVDPVGSCVGQKGVRIQAVIEALDGLEKIDVIQYSEDPVKYIANALSPAKNLEVTIREEEKTAIVRAPREDLPLVIGKEGQNVRLASMLSGYNIEVEGIEAPFEQTESPVEEKKDADEAKTETAETQSVEEPQEEKVADEVSKEPEVETETLKEETPEEGK
jgi:transcription termination/antitermination protein NusA